MRSLQLVNRLHLALRLVRRLQPIRSLPLVNKLHLVPRLLLRKRRRLRNQPGPLQVKKNLVSSELTATYCVMPLD
jgi:hypothetical protein